MGPKPLSLTICVSPSPLPLLGYYMYIEASRPRVAGDNARLLSPLYNVTAARGPKGSSRLPYCVSFFYHMKGKHIGEYLSHISSEVK